VKDVTKFIDYAMDLARWDCVIMVVNYQRQLPDFEIPTKAQVDNIEEFL
jgi:hypothetical protein